MWPPVVPPIRKKRPPLIIAIAIVVGIAGVGPWLVVIIRRRVGLRGIAGFVVIIVALDDALAHNRRRRALDHDVALTVDRSVEVGCKSGRDQAASGEKRYGNQSKPAHGMAPLAGPLLPTKPRARPIGCAADVWQRCRRRYNLPLLSRFGSAAWKSQAPLDEPEPAGLQRSAAPAARVARSAPPVVRAS